MANIIVGVEQKIEVAATDILNFFAKAQKAEPAAIAALGVLLGAASTVISDVSGVAAAPLNIALDEQTVSDLKAAWPAVVAFAATLGIKL